MKWKNKLCALAVASVVFVPGRVLADDAAKTYQVTGPIVELNESKIVVQKGNEKWEINRDAATKGAEKLKVGDKVTIHYRMHATRVESKSGDSKKKE
jgi:hypothetical protein